MHSDREAMQRRFIMTDNPEIKERPETVQGPQAERPEPAGKAGLYDRFAETTREIFGAGQEKGREAWEKAMESARERMTAAGEFSAEQGELFKRYLRRDLEQTGAEMRELGKGAKETLHPARLSAGALSSLSRLMNAAGQLLSELSARTEKTLEYESGEITMAGTLTCLSCGNKIQLKKTSVVPKCPNCEGTRFRKGY
jgi:isocitrate dehydrogenase